MLNKILYLYLESFTVPTECQTDMIKMKSSQLKKSLATSQSVLLMSTANQEPLRLKFLSYLERLQPAFRKFKHTKACRTLKQQVSDAEKIFDKPID